MNELRQLIEVENLVKVYPDGTRAVDDVSFEVRAGEIFGFLGPNGAGKTTTIRILVTLLPRTSGSAMVGGHEVERDPEAIRKMIGYAGQFIGIDVDLTGRENLILQGRLHGMSAAEAARRADVFLTTQYMEEADRLCTRLAIIDHGKIVVSGSPTQLKATVGGDVVTVALPEDADGGLVERAKRALAGFPGAGEPTSFDHSVAVPVTDAGQSLSALVRRLDEDSVPIAKLTFTTPTLNEVFLRYTGERMRVEDATTAHSSMFASMRGGRRG